MENGKGVLPTWTPIIIPSLDVDTLEQPISMRERRSIGAFRHPRRREMTMGEFPNLKITTYRNKTARMGYQGGNNIYWQQQE